MAVKCPICGRNMQRIKNEVIQVTACPFCGLFANKPLVLEEVTYKKRYQNKEREGIKSHKAVMQFTYAERALDRIRRYKERGHLLDIGCGKGHLLKLAKERGYKVEGVEISRKKVKSGKKLFGLRDEEIHQGNALTFPFKKNHYDILVLKALLEHIKELGGILEVCRNTLKQNGILYIDVPRYRNPIRLVLKRTWYAYGYKVHYWYFSQRSIRLLLQRWGFKVEEILTPTNSYLAYRLVKIARIFRVLYGIGDTIGDYTGWGDKLAVIARKD